MRLSAYTQGHFTINKKYAGSRKKNNKMNEELTNDSSENNSDKGYEVLI